MLILPSGYKAFLKNVNQRDAMVDRRIKRAKAEQGKKSFYERYTRQKFEREWQWRMRESLPLSLLHSMYEGLKTDQPYHEPNSGFVEKLKAISPTLSVHWLGIHQRWGLFIDHRSHYQFLWNGVFYTFQETYPLCITVICNKDKSYRPLDERSLPVCNLNLMDMYAYIQKIHGQDANRNILRDKRRKERIEEIKERRRGIVEPYLRNQLKVPQRVKPLTVTKEFK